jgi:23S rRNA (guanosine2251-2'-O)-methyltransferase
MRRLTREACDLTVRLPQSGAVESLNVSVAAAVALYAVQHERLEEEVA